MNELDRVKLWERYEKAKTYNENIGLYNTVQKCEDFYTGDQWKGLVVRDLDTPVFNILKRVVGYMTANIFSDDIGINLESFDENTEGVVVGDQEVPIASISKMIAKQIDQSFELGNVKRIFRKMLRNSAVDGDGCVHYYFDPDDYRGIRKGSNAGNIKAEIIENYNVFFGNPQNDCVEEQPWIMLQYRKSVEEARDMAKENGLKDLDLIQPDGAGQSINGSEEKDKVTIVRQYRRDKKTGTILCCEICHNCVIMDEKDTELTRYPLVWMPWEMVKNRYHGKSVVEVLIPNQIYINKLYAMAMQSVKQTAFPKVIYNRAMLPGGWSNRVGEAIPVNGAPENAVAQGFRPPDMSGQVFAMIAQVMNDSRDTMGASDAALGNIKPDNTSAIIATQKATAMPLEHQKQAYYDAVEDTVRIFMDMMATYFGKRIVTIDMPKEPDDDILLLEVESQELAMTQEPPTEPRDVNFDFGSMKGMDLRLNVDIGSATYWSELMQVQTADNLFQAGLIDAETYFEIMPNGYIRNKDKILENIKEKQEQAVAAGETDSAVPTEMNDIAANLALPN